MKKEITLDNGKIIKVSHATKEQRENTEISSLRRAAKIAGQNAVEKAFSKGLPITIGRNGKLIHVFPDGRETIIGELSKS